MIIQADCLSDIHYNDERQDRNSTSGEKQFGSGRTSSN
jgi:hypothetical protein